MPPFLCRCPNSGDDVQGWAADDPEVDDLTYVQVTCLACAQAHLVNPKTGKVLGSDDEQCYFQFDTRSRLRRFFVSSEGWSPLNKRYRPPRMQDATPSIAIRNAIPATAIPRRELPSTERGNDQKRRAPVDCSVIRTGGLGPTKPENMQNWTVNDPTDVRGPGRIWSSKDGHSALVTNRCAAFYVNANCVVRSDVNGTLNLTRHAVATTPAQRLGVCFAHSIQPYQPSPKGLSGRPAHRPFRGLLGVHSRCGPHTRAVTNA